MATTIEPSRNDWIPARYSAMAGGKADGGRGASVITRIEERGVRVAIAKERSGGAGHASAREATMVPSAAALPAIHGQRRADGWGLTVAAPGCTAGGGARIS